jgi:PAS domain S-box-containing protein
MAASVVVQEQQGIGLLNAVLESATNAAIVYDAEHDSVLANRKALELHGMPPPSTPFEEWGVYYEARWPGGVAAELEELPLSRACRGEPVPEVRLEIRPHVGEARTVDVRAEPLFDADRHQIGAMAIFRDVESSESAEQAARLRSAVTANMAEGVTVIRVADGHIVYVNDVVERMFGYASGEMVGRNVTAINPPNDATTAEIAAALRRDGEWHGEVETVRKDGTHLWCWANVSTFAHPAHGPVWIAVQTDMTERRKAEEALRHAEERFRKVFEEGPVGIVMFSDDLTITDGNGAFLHITGYTRDELIGRSIAEVTYPADAVLDVDRAHRVFTGELPSYRAEKRCLTRDGGTVWVSFTATMVRDDAGKPLYGLGIVEDISERKRIEALMTRQNERLATDLESSLAELQLSRARILASADLERRRIERDLHDGAQQRLVALRVRLGLAQDLLREDPLRGSAMLSDLGNDVDAALEEVRMLARGVYPSVLGDRGLVEALRAAARNSPLAVSIRASAVGRLPEEIETAVYFACVEALQNAAKHAQCETSVLISLRQGKRLRFEVRDDGVGFKVNGKPAGAGLANMRDRIAAVGGRLTIESASGQGTCVSGSVPLH